MTQYEREQITMDEFVGLNGFIDDPVETLAATGFVREYHDWHWDEADGSSNYPGYPDNEIKFDPSYAGDGWNFDQYYADVADAGLDVVLCTQGCPAWVGGHVNGSSKPLDEADADPTDPNSYEAKAHHLFQLAARYGNTSVDASKLTLADDQEEKTGLGLLTYFEDWNEQDKDWEGSSAYFAPEEYAAMASATYDGHADTMDQGTGTFGVKNADPDAKFVMGGIAKLDLQYVEDMDAWFQNNRPDGQFVPDVINVHHYSYVDGEHGLAPEEDDYRSKLAEFTTWRDDNYPEVEVWISEFGWDTHPDSELSARAIGSYDTEEVQGQWLVRAYLAFAAAGVDRAQMYMLRDIDSTSGARFFTCGLTGPKADGWPPKPSWYYVSTMRNTLWGTRFADEKAAGRDDVRIYTFADQSGSGGVYALWCPTTSETYVNDYTLNFDGSPSSATLVEMVDGNETGQSSSLSISDNSVTVDVSERPIFVKVDDI